MIWICILLSFFKVRIFARFQNWSIHAKFKVLIKPLVTLQDGWLNRKRFRGLIEPSAISVGYTTLIKTVKNNELMHRQIPGLYVAKLWFHSRMDKTKVKSNWCIVKEVNSFLKQKSFESVGRVKEAEKVNIDVPCEQSIGDILFLVLLFLYVGTCTVVEFNMVIP